jgi:hypothetical protein
MNARKAANVIVLRHTLAMTTVDVIALTIVVTTLIVTTMNIAVRTIHATMILLLKGCDDLRRHKDDRCFMRYVITLVYRTIPIKNSVNSAL